MKRLLMVCDLGRIHWNVGEHLHFQAVSLIKRIECGAKKIDIAWLYNSNKPAFGKTGVTNVNYQYHLSKLLPLAHVNPYLGSFILTDSLDTLKLERYESIFPPSDLLGTKAMVNKMPIVDEFYEKNGYIPHVSCNEGMLLWARSFFELRKITFPVAVHLRRSFGSKRNSDYDTWMRFFSLCRSRKKWRAMTFIIVGTRQEIDPRFREIGNVVFSKDYNTTVEQDCALIQSSLMFMCGPSGPSAMAIWGEVPYLVFNFQMPSQYRGGPFQWPWHTPLQKLIWARETVGFLMKEFTQLIDRIDRHRWLKTHAKPSFPVLKRTGRSSMRPDDW